MALKPPTSPVQKPASPVHTLPSSVADTNGQKRRCLRVVVVVVVVQEEWFQGSRAG